MIMNDQEQMRQFFLTVWSKRNNPECLSPLEQQILSVIEAHKEYETLLDDPDSVLQEYRTDNNPFLHMGLHLGVIEQLTTNRPAGIRDLYQKAYKKFQDEHQVQHLFMDVMADIIYEAQQKNELPDELIYLEHLRKRINQKTP